MTAIYHPINRSWPLFKSHLGTKSFSIFYFSMFYSTCLLISIISLNFHFLYLDRYSIHSWPIQPIVYDRYLIRILTQRAFLSFHFSFEQATLASSDTYKKCCQGRKKSWIKVDRPKWKDVCNQAWNDLVLRNWISTGWILRQSSSKWEVECSTFRQHWISAAIDRLVWELSVINTVDDMAW